MKSNRTWRVMALMLVLALMIGACSGGAESERSGTDDAGEPQHGGELVVGRLGDIESWNPDLALATQTFQTLPQVYESLIQYDDEFKNLEPALAESWEFSEEELTFTFILREGLKFSDGSSLTSEDVKFSLEQAKKGPALGFLYAAIKSIEAPDEETVLVKLSEYDSTIETYFTYPPGYIVPKAYGGKSADEFFENPIGAGPFAVESYRPGDEMVLVRNENYWEEGKPYLDGVTLKVFGDENERLLAFQAGDIDVVEVVTKGRETQLAEDRVYWVEPTAVVDELVVNQNVKPLDEEPVRRAMSLAINREDIVDGLLEGRGSPAEGAMTPHLLHSVGASQPYEYDLEAARSALAESSVPDGFSTTVLVDRSQAYPEVIQVVQSQLAEIGIDLQIETVDSNTWIDALIAGEYELLDIGLKNFLAEVIDVFQLYAITEGFFAGAETNVAQQALSDYKAARTPEEKDAAVRMLEDEIRQTYALIPIVQWDHAYGVADDVEGFFSTPDLVYYLEEVWKSS